jgi:hypothetical protein
MSVFGTRKRNFLKKDDEKSGSKKHFRNVWANLVVWNNTKHFKYTEDLKSVIVAYKGMIASFSKKIKTTKTYTAV